jgi:hypothetical protein
MKRLNLTVLGVGLILLAACHKQAADETSGSTTNAAEKSELTAALACQPAMYALRVDSVSGISYVYKVTGSPSTPPVTVTPYTVAGSNVLIDCSTNTPIRWATGLAYDPTSGIFYGTTGAFGPTPNRIFRFTDPNCASVGLATTACLNALDLSDVERDPASGRFYAINRSSTVPASNRVVVLGLPGSLTVNCLANALPAGFRPRGLTFDCNRQLFVMHTAGTSGTLGLINSSTGALLSTFPYPGPVTTAPLATPELGLHFDCLCIKEFITGSWHMAAGPTLMTDGLPSGLGGPLYNSTVNALPPIVDFARP